MQSQEKAEEHIRRGYNVGRHGEGIKTPLHFTAQKGHMSIVKLLLNAGVDVEAPAYHGIALHYAAIGEHEDVFQFLWEAGINAFRKDCFEMIAFGYAFSSTVDAVEKNSKSSSQGTANAM